MNKATAAPAPAREEFGGKTLPFTSHGWTRQFKSGTFRNGGTWKHVEKVKVLSRGSMGTKLEEVHIIASWDIDQGGNMSANSRKGQHFLSLKKGARELAFAIHDRSDGWRILSYDCSHYAVVKTQKQAEAVLNASNWRKWDRRAQVAEREKRK